MTNDFTWLVINLSVRFSRIGTKKIIHWSLVIQLLEINGSRLNKQTKNNKIWFQLTPAASDYCIELGVLDRVVMRPSPITREKLENCIKVRRSNTWCSKRSWKVINFESKLCRRKTGIWGEKEYICWRKYRLSLAYHYERDEEFFTNDLLLKLEQECLVNRLMRKINENH